MLKSLSVYGEALNRNCLTPIVPWADMKVEKEAAWFATGDLARRKNTHVRLGSRAVPRVKLRGNAWEAIGFELLLERCLQTGKVVCDIFLAHIRTTFCKVSEPVVRCSRHFAGD